MSELVAKELKKWFRTHEKAYSDVASDLGVSVQFVSMIANGRKSIGKELAEKLFNLYGLSRAFLLTGEGSIDGNDRPCITEQPIDQCSLVNAALAAKYETIAALHKSIEAKEEVIMAKDEVISSLRQQMSVLNQLNEKTKEKYPYASLVSDERQQPKKD